MTVLLHCLMIVGIVFPLTIALALFLGLSFLQKVWDEDKYKFSHSKSPNYLNRFVRDPVGETLSPFLSFVVFRKKDWLDILLDLLPYQVGKVVFYFLGACFSLIYISLQMLFKFSEIMLDIGRTFSRLFKLIFKTT